MSATRNAESMTNQGEFHSRVPRAEPMQTGGHKPGVKVGNDAYPEFHAEKYPPGTAPNDERTFQPRPTGEVPAQALNYTDTTDNIVPGATSADVHTGLGKPMQGQENRELHGKRKNKREGAGLEGVGASVGVDLGKQKGGHLPGDVETGTTARGKASAEYPSASERIPEGAETVAAERA
ncbi:hypothetical protein UCREL1_1657 [Eutypa lata UCREL1]|uniref:Uncharacterized protein n=1 Tax=Eutypa lata (strain UCR-EL1) TaxID=1287681 RepID=M7TN08_EUTLA|nr:hypothetical protein UCREL1_1657 [Eutypa lata UCREL1]